MSKELEFLKRKLERERKARRAAEQILESKSLELFKANEELREINNNLEELVKERTEDLRRTESRFELIVETANDIIYRNDKEGNFTYANPAALELLGYTLEELKEIHFSELVEPEHLEDVISFYEKQYQEKIPGTYKEFPIITKNKETVWLGQNVIYQFDKEDNLKQISTVARNITDSKISQTRLNNLITNLQSGVLLEDENRKIALVNQRFCNKFGIPAKPEQLIGVDCIAAIEQSKVLFKEEEEFVDRVNEILQNRKLVLNDILFLKDGRIFERDYIPVFIENRYSGHLWNYRDVTEQHKIVDAIRRSEEKYRGIIENMNLGLIEVDLEEKIQYANQSFCQMCGYEADEILGKVASELFVRGENAEEMSNKNLLRQEGVSDAYELAIRNKRGEKKWWLISGGPLINPEGTRIGSIGIHYDITEEKKLQSDLVDAKYLAEESAKAKEIFLANMSHEIRTPMNGIVGMARQLSKTSLTKDQTFYLDTIKVAADNLLVILNDILDLSKIEAGKLSVEKVPFDVRNSMKQSCMVLAPKAEEKGLQLNCNVDSSVESTLIGDPFRLNQVMLNVIGNAIKFTEKGSIDINCTLSELKTKEAALLINVQDSGIGMEQDYLEKIFDQFSQEDRSTARQYGGTGLGMNISQQLVSLMGGELTIFSEKGKGTTVSIKIPYELTTHDQAVLTDIKEADYSLLKGKRVLIAEDNELNRLVIETTLSYYDMKMEFATNGKEAISHLERKNFDLILMDVQMPVMDGIEACRFIRKNITRDLPIIALTANVFKGDRDIYFSEGMNDIVPKPFEEKELMDVLMKWVASGKKINLNDKPEVKKSENLSFSLKKLEEISRGNQGFVDRMLTIFYKQSNDAIIQLKEAVENNDHLSISKIAHKIKPSLDNLAIDILTDKVRELEKIDQEKEITEVSELVKNFCDLLEKVVQKIKNNTES